MTRRLGSRSEGIGCPAYSNQHHRNLAARWTIVALASNTDHSVIHREEERSETTLGFRDVTPANDTVGHKSQDRELHPKYSDKNTSGAPVSHLEDQITSLDLQLQKKEVQLQETHAALLQQGPRPMSNAGLPEARIRDQFETLANSSRDWISKYFGDWVLEGPLAVDAMPPSAPRRDRSNYEALLKAPQMACLVLQGLLGEIVSHAFASEMLLGSKSLSDLKQKINTSQGTH